MSLLNTNNVYVVGELVEVKDYHEGTYNDGNQNYVSATIVVKSVVDGEELLTEARTFISELTKNGAVNKNYTTIKNISQMLNKRVVVSGAQLVGERFWSAKTSQLANAVRIRFNLIRLANKADAEDKATFEFGGFVTKPLAEVVDENNETRYYQISLGQANYKEDNMFQVTFTVPKDNIEAIRAMSEKYESGATVKIDGVCKTIVTTRTIENEVAFGTAIPKTYTNVDRKFIIVGGSPVIVGKEAGEYGEEDITRLVAAYKAEGAEIQQKATTTAKDAPTPKATAPKPKAKNSSLAGLI